MKIGIIGSGAWGTALASALVREGKDVTIWGRNKEDLEELRKFNTLNRYLPNISLPDIKINFQLPSLVQESEVLILAVPSSAIEEIVSLLEGLPPRYYVSLIKGLAPSGETITSYLKERLKVKVGVLSGPSFAKDVASGLPTAVVFAGCVEVSQLFHTGILRVYHSDDVQGVEICSVAKNVLAIGAGIVEGLDLGDSAKASLITRGFAELSLLIKALGCNEKTAYGLAGAGDLILTATSEQSRNRNFGKLIGQGRKVADAFEGKTVEGYRNSKFLYELAERLNLDIPICREVYKILHHGKRAITSIQEILSRGQKGEF